MVAYIFGPLCGASLAAIFVKFIAFSSPGGSEKAIELVEYKNDDLIN